MIIEIPVPWFIKFIFMDRYNNLSIDLWKQRKLALSNMMVTTQHCLYGIFYTIIINIKIKKKKL
jgi:hypothetical protein